MLFVLPCFSCVSTFFPCDMYVQFTGRTTTTRISGPAARKRSRKNRRSSTWRRNGRRCDILHVVYSCRFPHVREVQKVVRRESEEDKTRTRRPGDGGGCHQLAAVTTPVHPGFSSSRLDSTNTPFLGGRQNEKASPFSCFFVLYKHMTRR